MVTTTVSNDTGEFLMRQSKTLSYRLVTSSDVNNGANTTTYVDGWISMKVTESVGLTTVFLPFVTLMRRVLSGKLAAGHCQKAPPPKCRQATTQSPQGEPGNHVCGVNPHRAERAER